MAASITQYRFDACLEIVQHIQGHKRLNRSGESSSMDPVGAPAIQQARIAFFVIASPSAS